MVYFLLLIIWSLFLRSGSLFLRKKLLWVSNSCMLPKSTLHTGLNFWYFFWQQMFQILKKYLEAEKKIDYFLNVAKLYIMFVEKGWNFFCFYISKIININHFISWKKEINLYTKLNFSICHSKVFNLSQQIFRFVATNVFLDLS